MTSLKVQTDGRILIVRFTDADLSDQWKVLKIGTELRDLIGHDSRRQMLLNFKGVRRISSIMIGQLFLLKNQCRAANIDLKLCCLEPVIREIFDVVQLANFFDTHDDEDAAREAFHQEFDVAAGEDEGVTADQCRRAAEKGDAAAQYDWALRNDEGRGVAQNTAEAFAWYNRAADQGHTDAQYMLGKSYAYGIHVSQDFGQAIHWFQKAAEQGHRDAQYAMGMSHHYGIGVGEDKSAATAWYRKAADQGHHPAQLALEQIKDTDHHALDR